MKLEIVKLLPIKKKEKAFLSGNCPLISSLIFIFISISLIVVPDLFILMNFILFMMMYDYLPHGNVSVA